MINYYNDIKALISGSDRPQNASQLVAKGHLHLLKTKPNDSNEAYKGSKFSMRRDTAYKYAVKVDNKSSSEPYISLYELAGANASHPIGKQIEHREATLKERAFYFYNSEQESLLAFIVRALKCSMQVYRNSLISKKDQAEENAEAERVSIYTKHYFRDYIKALDSATEETLGDFCAFYLIKPLRYSFSLNALKKVKGEAIFSLKAYIENFKDAIKAPLVENYLSALKDFEEELEGVDLEAIKEKYNGYDLDSKISRYREIERAEPSTLSPEDRAIKIVLTLVSEERSYKDLEELLEDIEAGKARGIEAIYNDIFRADLPEDLEALEKDQEAEDQDTSTELVEYAREGSQPIQLLIKSFVSSKIPESKADLERVRAYQEARRIAEDTLNGLRQDLKRLNAKIKAGDYTEETLEQKELIERTIADREAQVREKSRNIVINDNKPRIITSSIDTYINGNNNIEITNAEKSTILEIEPSSIIESNETTAKILLTCILKKLSQNTEEIYFSNEEIYKVINNRADNGNKKVEFLRQLELLQGFKFSKATIKIGKSNKTLNKGFGVVNNFDPDYNGVLVRIDKVFIEDIIKFSSPILIDAPDTLSDRAIMLLNFIYNDLCMNNTSDNPRGYLEETITEHLGIFTGRANYSGKNPKRDIIDPINETARELMEANIAEEVKPLDRSNTRLRVKLAKDRREKIDRFNQEKERLRAEANKKK